MKATPAPAPAPAPAPLGPVQSDTLRFNAALDPARCFDLALLIRDAPAVPGGPRRIARIVWEDEPLGLACARPRGEPGYSPVALYLSEPQAQALAEVLDRAGVKMPADSTVATLRAELAAANEERAKLLAALTTAHVQVTAPRGAP